MRKSHSRQFPEWKGPYMLIQIIQSITLSDYEGDSLIANVLSKWSSFLNRILIGFNQALLNGLFMGMDNNKLREFWTGSIQDKYCISQYRVLFIVINKINSPTIRFLSI